MVLTTNWAYESNSLRCSHHKHLRLQSWHTSSNEHIASSMNDAYTLSGRSGVHYSISCCVTQLALECGYCILVLYSQCGYRIQGLYSQCGYHILGWYSQCRYRILGLYPSMLPEIDPFHICSSILNPYFKTRSRYRGLGNKQHHKIDVRWHREQHNHVGLISSSALRQFRCLSSNPSPHLTDLRTRLRVCTFKCSHCCLSICIWYDTQWSTYMVWRFCGQCRDSCIAEINSSHWQPSWFTS